MFFDFDKFSSITASVYADSPYSLAEVLEVFRYYFEQYEAYTGAPHPPIRAVQIERIIREMPYIDETDKANSTMDIDPDCYEDMIDKHLSNASAHACSCFSLGGDAVGNRCAISSRRQHAA